MKFINGCVIILVVLVIAVMAIIPVFAEEFCELDGISIPASIEFFDGTICFKNSVWSLKAPTVEYYDDEFCFGRVHIVYFQQTLEVLDVI